MHFNMLSGLSVILSGSGTRAGLWANFFLWAKVNLFSVSRVVQQVTHTNQFTWLLITPLLGVPDCRAISVNADAVLRCLWSAWCALSSLCVPSAGVFSDGGNWCPVWSQSTKLQGLVFEPNSDSVAYITQRVLLITLLFITWACSWPATRAEWWVRSLVLVLISLEWVCQAPKPPDCKVYSPSGFEWSF